MASKSPARPAPVAGDAGDLRAKLTEAEGALNALLIEGGNTAPTRSRSAALRRQIADAADVKAAKAAEIERAAHERISVAAGDIAASAAERIAGVLADLQPPPWPLPV
jgi:hypothetical protein